MCASAIPYVTKLKLPVVSLKGPSLTHSYSPSWAITFSVNYSFPVTCSPMMADKTTNIEITQCNLLKTMGWAARNGMAPNASKSLQPLFGSNPSPTLLLLNHIGTRVPLLQVKVTKIRWTLTCKECSGDEGQEYACLHAKRVWAIRAWHLPPGLHITRELRLRLVTK